MSGSALFRTGDGDALRAAASAGDARADPSRGRRSARLLRLVDKARAGDRAAFDRLWREHRRVVHAVLLGCVRAAEAEDLLQDVALAGWEGIGALRDAASFRGWLIQIARNVGCREARRLVRRSGELEVEAVDPRGPAVDPALAAEADEVLDRIRRLPECYREPLLLRLVLGLSGQEIAEQVGMTPGSVRVNLHRGMQMLRRELADQGGDGESGGSPDS